jgi:hypothetical protein
MGTKEKSAVVIAAASSNIEGLTMIANIQKTINRVKALTDEVRSYHPNTSDFEELSAYEDAQVDMEDSASDLADALSELVARVEDTSPDDGDFDAEDYEDD